jgi:hypothetical protein
VHVVHPGVGIWAQDPYLKFGATEAVQSADHRKERVENIRPRLHDVRVEELGRV